MSAPVPDSAAPVAGAPAPGTPASAPGASPLVARGRALRLPRPTRERPPGLPRTIPWAGGSCHPDRRVREEIPPLGAARAGREST